LGQRASALQDLPTDNRRTSMKDKHISLTYEDFQLRATNATCSENEKIGFPDSYRGGAEQSILDDVLAKLPALKQPRATII
jgi:hypothetical protein